ncbi:MAG TPA: nuclear transport factor 2 family protein [Gemmatimonadales bacterium]|nr:nuclear transport factor 2 family protein [Gemmatimonadales bacterium]
MSARLDTARAYEAALFAGKMDEVGRLFTDDITYWVAGAAPIGGERKGRTAVIRAFENREFGLGAADWGYQDVWRVWYEADERVIVEIRERSWLKTHPDDVMDQRTCVVIRFVGDRIAEMRDYADSHIYEEFLRRHRDELTKFKGRG